MNKDKLLAKLNKKPFPRDFTVQELDLLMAKCGCIKRSGGRGSSIAYYHQSTGHVLIFDRPHPGNSLYVYQIKKVLTFLMEIGEYKP